MWGLRRECPAALSVTLLLLLGVVLLGGHLSAVRDLHQLLDTWHLQVGTLALCTCTIHLDGFGVRRHTQQAPCSAYKELLSRFQSH